MVKECKKSGFQIVIPIANMGELSKYQRGLLGVLRKVEVGNCDPRLKENLKSVYELLSHLVPDKNSLIREGELLTRTQKGKLKKVVLQS
jgi:hypothetical protein